MVLKFSSKERAKAAAVGAAVLASLGSITPALSVSAADNATITIDDGGVSGAQYEAYRLMDLTTSLKGQDSDGNNEYNYSYTLAGKYDSILEGIVGDNDGVSGFDGRDVMHYLTQEGVDVRSFADSVYAGIRAGSIAADVTPEGKSFTAPQGYYLIVEKQKGASPDSYSLVMLDTLGQENITVATKEDVPSVKKELSGAETVKAGDVALGDTVHFVLTGSMPENIASYAKYKYVFHDQADPGISIKADTVKVQIDGVDAAGFTAAAGTDGCDLEVSFADIKNGNTVTKDSQVVVTYDAEIVEAVTVGTPNVNGVHLEFSNNVYEDGSTDTTPEDKTRLYTYSVLVTKQDDEKQALKGANFELQMKQADGSYAKVREITFDGEKTEFLFEKLDAGSYRLVETRVPDGYVKIDDVDFTIGSSFGATEADENLYEIKTLTAAKDADSKGDASFTADMASGQVSTIVVNVPGSKLPSTGGTGTYALYLGGGVVLAMGLGLCVVAAKKKKEAE